jgi:hypothetical protein
MAIDKYWSRRGGLTATSAVAAPHAVVTGGDCDASAPSVRVPQRAAAWSVTSSIPDGATLTGPVRWLAELPDRASAVYPAGIAALLRGMRSVTGGLVVRRNTCVAVGQTRGHRVRVGRRR